MNPPARGSLLVAAPTLTDPNFARTVVLLLACDEDGALGVVLNRPSDTPIAEIVPSWALHVSPPGVLFTGGPVQPNAAICVGHHVGEVADVPYTAEEPEGGYSPLTPDLGTVDLHKEPGEIDVSFAGLRVFKGYAGWGRGQLEDEIAEDAWFVVDASPEVILTPDPESLWQSVLEAQGGWFAVLSRHPLDPSLN